MHTRFNRFWYSLILLLPFLGGCEDVIQLDLEEGSSQLVIDAWITDQPEMQEVRLSLSGAYLESGDLPVANGAQVAITDDAGNAFPFIDPDNDGVYTWSPENDGEALGQIGRAYTLSVEYEGERYEAVSQIKRVPPIDSLTYEFREESFFDPAGYFAVLWARDLPGTGDTYWIRTYKNGEFLNRPQDINLAYDASFSRGANNDGLVFIVPIREGINPEFEDEDGEELPPYQPGDTVRVEIYSTTEDAFDFLRLMQEQLTATGGLLAVPLANLPTNIRNVDPNSDKTALGYFGASAVSAAETVIEETEEGAAGQ